MKTLTLYFSLVVLSALLCKLLLPVLFQIYTWIGPTTPLFGVALAYLCLLEFRFHRRQLPPQHRDEIRSYFFAIFPLLGSLGTLLAMTTQDLSDAINSTITGLSVALLVLARLIHSKSRNYGQ